MNVTAGEQPGFETRAASVGITAQVLFAGLTPTHSGLYQVNVLVPAGVTSAKDVPVISGVVRATLRSRPGAWILYARPYGRASGAWILYARPYGRASGAGILYARPYGRASGAGILYARPCGRASGAGSPHPPAIRKADRRCRTESLTYVRGSVLAFVREKYIGFNGHTKDTERSGAESPLGSRILRDRVRYF